ncbi:MAG: PID-CTERM protein-sorting domain-containing protein [Janthinobacterium lividum]
MKSSLFFTPGLLALAVLLSVPAVAQQPTTGGPAPTTPDPTAVPLDGGASLLLAGGVAYGIRQLRARRLARRATQ